MFNPLAADATGRSIPPAQLMLLFCGLLAGLIPAALAGGTDLEQPAQLQITIVDEEHRALPAARVWWQEGEPVWPETSAARTLLPVDASGRVDLQRHRPDDATRIVWTERLQIELDGFVSRDLSVWLFPGTQQQVTVTMQREHVTLIRLRGPRDQPLPRVTLIAQHVRGGASHSQLLFTDDQGECRWRHTHLDEGYSIAAMSDDWNATSGGRLRRDDAVITLAFDEAPLPFSSRLLQGRLLNDDGSIASGWFVARRANHFGGRGIIHGPYYNDLKLQQLTPVDAAGSFEADVDAQGCLVVVSPAGIPLLYWLAPRSWPPGVRDVSLRLPSVRRVRQGVVVDEHDEPVAGLPLKLHSVQWNGQNRMFTTAAPASPPEPRSQSRAADTTTMPSPRTDRQGNYSIAIYTGSTAEFQIGWDDLIALSTQERHVWRREKRASAKDLEDLSKLKRVTLQFEDEQRQPVESIWLDRVEMYAGDQVVSRSAGGVRDVRGLHLFVDSAVDRIDLWTRDLATSRSTAASWLPLETSIEVPGSDDQSIRIPLPETLRQRPLSGRVLDPEGHPVAGVSLSLLRPASEPLDARSGRGPHLGITTTSDAQGQFLFAAAPDDCRIRVWQNRQVQSDPLPGWTDPVDVDRQSRDVTIQLQRGGTVKVLLPQSTEHAADGMRLSRQDAAADDGRWGRYEYFRLQSADPPVIVSEILPPGYYLLTTTGSTSAFTEPLAARGPMSADVVASAQTVIDLRDLATAPGGDRLQPIKRSTDLSITHDGRPVSGADVMVFTAAARPEELTRWIEQSQSDDAAMKEAALAMLSDAGALAIDAIKNAEQLADLDQLLAELGDLESTGLLPVVYDLSDSRGMIRCEVEAGAPCVAVARVRGQLIGWQSWIADGQAVTVDLKPSRTLAVRLTAPERPDDIRHDLRWFDLKLQQPASPGTAALMSALCRDYGYAFSDQPMWMEPESIQNHYYRLHQDDPTTWVMEDLPAGIHCTIRLHREPESEEADSPQSRSILIDPGDGVQMLRW